MKFTRRIAALLSLILCIVVSTALAWLPSPIRQSTRTRRSNPALFYREHVVNGDIKPSGAVSKQCQPQPSLVTTLKTGMTLSRYMRELTHDNPELHEIESIFSSLQTATKTISNLVRRAQLTGHTGNTDEGAVNVQGEEQKKLDVLTNDILKEALKYTGKVSILASEEEDDPISIDHRGQLAGQNVIVDHEGRFTALFDPLDGSANADAGIPVGTIFGIFRNVDSIDHEGLQNTLQAGRKLVAAGYCLYSSYTTLVFSLGDGLGVHGFTLDDAIGEYVLTHPDIQIPTRGKIFSFNQGNYFDWDSSTQDYIRNLQLGLGETQTRYSSRYIGSMVGDTHRTLLYGGIFGYPADRNHPQGKLRLLYEAAPMAFLVEQAGGLALSDQDERILDVQPKSVHQRVPCVYGSRDDVLEWQSYHKE